MGELVMRESVSEGFGVYIKHLLQKGKNGQAVVTYLREKNLMYDWSDFLSVANIHPLQKMNISMCAVANRTHSNRYF